MTFDDFILSSTGRNIAYHERAGTTGIDFAREAWNAAVEASLHEVELSSKYTPEVTVLRMYLEALKTPLVLDHQEGP